MLHIQDIRALQPFEEIDYLSLQDILKDYSQPRNKIRTLLKTGDLIRIKKGLYVFGKKGAREPYCKEHLANLIYGPSAISLEYALSYYGLIPERVETVTNITTNRNKLFNTPVGQFKYQYLNYQKYFLGIQQIIIAGRTILMASPAKALCDKLFLFGFTLDNFAAIENFLFNDLRINENNFYPLSQEISTMAPIYNHHNLDLLQKYIVSKQHA